MLNQKIAAMKKKRGSFYKPRTRHLMADGSAKYTNRLFLESSPYLLQHAHNPVNWYPWGDEAFETAKKLNRPLFVSIGYSTCHWCHVMEEESFEDEEIAEFINNNFIPVKVDREELPDVDAVYMLAVQIMTGSGGWPLNVWLTPERVPFCGGTYFPPREGERGVLIGFLSILKRINTIYRTKHEDVLATGKQLKQHMKQALIPVAGKSLPDVSLIDSVVQSFEKIYDPINGGTLPAPKFPSTLNLRLLLRSWKNTGNAATLEMVNNTLLKMGEGGIYDHIGGGFHRYATDAKWLVPHFEKMLYDNAMLVITYLEGWQATGKMQFQNISREVLDYVAREMTSDEGGFYSATDADTLTPSGKKEEGYFFTWTIEELKSALDESDYAVLKRYYSIGPVPDFEGRHILHITANHDNIADELGLSDRELTNKINAIKKVLYKERQKKEPPFTDTKILASWNGLMISAFARAGLILDDKSYTALAKKAAGFVLSNLVKDDRLFRIYKDGMVKHKAYLDDYAFMVAAFMDIYEATDEKVWLENAIFFNKLMITLFEDKTVGGFFMASTEHDALPAKEKPGYDGVIPSGNAIAVLNMLRLYLFTGESDYLNHAEKTLIAFSEQIRQNPEASTEMLIALDYYYHRP